MIDWSCPVCSSPLHQDAKVWHCDNKHHFDKAKEGYMNLLLANQKSSKLPGDSPAMLKARREFLLQGFYDPVAEALANTICELIPSTATKSSPRILDSGCGEGYYLGFLQKRLPSSANLAGIDIAKEGVRLAAKKIPTVSWVCGSAARLPVSDKSLDFLLRIFAPGDNEEALRCLSDEGYLIVLSPAEKHLREIKDLIYDEATLHTKPKDVAGFSLLQQNQFEYVLQLSNSEAIKNLLSMTPFFWQGSHAAKEHLLSLENLSVSVHVFVSVYKKINSNSESIELG